MIFFLSCAPKKTIIFQNFETPASTKSLVESESYREVRGFPYLSAEYADFLGSVTVRDVLFHQKKKKEEVKSHNFPRKTALLYSDIMALYGTVPAHSSVVP